MHPEVVGAKLVIDSSNKLQCCVLPCTGSKECDCFTDWDVNSLIDVTEVCG